MSLAVSNKRNYRLLTLIIISGFILRILQLDFQSLWIDELNTMNISDPDESWSFLFDHLKSSDQHPPLHFILLRFCFAIFGHTSVVARFISVLAGTISIWVMYVLGKELWNKNAGIVAALLTSVNYYHISFSQEARNYIFAFLFTALAFVYLIRFFKDLRLKNGLLYGLFTLLLLYTHYYGLFVAFSQAVLCGIFYFDQEKENRSRYVKRLAVSVAIPIIGYALWIPYLIFLSEMTSFWIPQLSNTVLTDFFYGYFGNSNLLNPILSVLMVFYVFRIMQWSELKDHPLRQPLIMGFVILFVWILGTYLPPYLRSYILFPVLLSRYTIVVLPAFIIALAFGIELIGNKYIKTFVMVVFVLFSLLDISCVKKYYTSVIKTQFREVTDFVMEHNADHYPVITSYDWQLKYYFKAKHDSTTALISRRKMAAVDSIVQLINTPDRVYGFWLVEGHWNNPPLTANELLNMGSCYTMVSRLSFEHLNTEYFDAWAELYMYSRPDSNYQLITYTDFQNGANWDDNKVKPVWNGKPVIANPVHLKPGKYRLTLAGFGSDAKGTDGKIEFAILKMQANGVDVGEFLTKEFISNKEFEFNVDQEKDVTFQFMLANDYTDPETQKDRNGFINFLAIRRIQ